MIIIVAVDLGLMVRLLAGPEEASAGTYDEPVVMVSGRELLNPVTGDQGEDLRNGVRRGGAGAERRSDCAQYWVGSVNRREADEGLYTSRGAPAWRGSGVTCWEDEVEVC